MKVWAFFVVQESREDVDLELYFQSPSDADPVIPHMMIPRTIENPTWADVLTLAQQKIPKSIYCYARETLAEESVKRFQVWFLKACELVCESTLASSFENG